MDGLTFKYDEANSASGALLVIGYMVFRRHPINGAESGKMGLEDNAVLQLDMFDAKWAKQHAKG
jgi:hypothetical protein